MPQNPQREQVVYESIRALHPPCTILLHAAETTTDEGREILYHAYVYLHAALLADFVYQAKQDDWIGPGTAVLKKA